MLPTTMEWMTDKKILRLLDQRTIPNEVKFRDCVSYEDVALSIEDMTVRGAPAIGAAAAYGVAVASWRGKEFVRAAIKRLSATRPTAVNLYWSLKRMSDIFECNSDSADLPLLLECEAVRIHEDDIRINKLIAEYGQTLLPNEGAVITHCNAGALATAGYGTALGVFRAAAEHGKKLKIYADETRPRLQGSKLTAFELYEDGFDVTVICDSMAAFLMSRVKIDAVITGADRIAANGDTANKIGTYSLAVAAKRHEIPFYIAAPMSTIDIDCRCGGDIPIEERSGDEVRSVDGVSIFSESIKVWNPAFDVTPSDLIAGIITEKGVLTYPYSESIKNLFSE